MMTKGPVVCCFMAATAGQQGVNLGSDESQVVLLEYALIDLNSNKVLGVQEYLVKPSDELEGSFLSCEVLAETRVTEQTVKLHGIPIDKAIQQFESYLGTVGLSATNVNEFRLVTDGQLAMRQVLHPETWRKGIHLPDYYTWFCDLRKDVAQFYGSDTQFSAISDMLIYLDIPHSGESDFYAYEFRDMINIVQRLITDGYKFSNIETVNLVLEPGICSKDEEVDSNCVVRARGLPWQSSDKDIAKFFRGLNIVKGGVALCLSPMGRRNGEALVRFTCQEHRDMALKRHKHHIGQRYIEVYRASGEDFVSVAGGCNNDAQAFLTKGAHVIIRMRGLPYECTAKQVIEFFEAGENPCSVMDGEEGVLFVKKPDGRSTGDAFVLFQDESDAPKALSRHRESIGTRYIELFRSTTAEVQQVLNRTMECFEKAQLVLQQQQQKATAEAFMAAAVSQQAHLQQQQAKQVAMATAIAHQQAAAAVVAGLVPQPTHVLQPPQPPPPPPTAAALAPPIPPLLPQHVITSGTRKDCIRLRGLPYEAQVEHILDFLGEHSKSIIFQGVHMVYNSQGQPSGEAFIQMESESAAFMAAQAKHHRYINFGKKPRYIEVFQCSGDDMSVVLTGGLPSTPGQLSPVAKPVLSPGSLQAPPTAPQIDYNDLVMPPMLLAPAPQATQQTPLWLPPPNPADFIAQPAPSLFLVPKVMPTAFLPTPHPAVSLPQLTLPPPAPLKRTWNQAFHLPPPPIPTTSVPPPTSSAATQVAAAQTILPPPPKRPTMPASTPSTSTFFAI